MSEPEVTLKWKKLYYEAVPHLYEWTISKDGQTVTKSEIEIRICKLGEEKADSHFVQKLSDGKRVFFAQAYNAPKFEAFKNGLAQTCQQEPICCDPDGYTLDGFVRWFALLKLGIEPKYEIVGNLPDDAAKVTWIRQRKLARQNLSETQRMAIVQAEIVAHPERIHNWIARSLGVAYNTVKKYRAKLEEAGKIQPVLKLKRSDGGTETHTPERPKTPEEIAAKEAKAKKMASERLFAKVKREFGHIMLDRSEPVKSLVNVEQFLLNVEVPSWMERQFRDALAKLAQAIQAKLPPGTVQHVAATRTTAWNVLTLPTFVDKARFGLKGKAPAGLPPQCDVVELPPGEHPVKLVRRKAILLVPHAAEDATITTDEQGQAAR